MSYLEEFMEKLSPLPNNTNRLLRLIRFLDKRVEAIQATLISQQKKFEVKVKELKEKKITEFPPEMIAEYQAILSKQKELYGYAKEKEDISQQLLFEINENYELIKSDLKNKLKDKPAEEPNVNVTKKKKKPESNVPKPPPRQDQYLYDLNDLKYCYCLRGSFGEMVGCENPYCQKQWFHLECVDEKSVTGVTDWYCNDCLKLKQKFKKPFIKEFL